jgi:hypothetical protein
MNWRRDFYFYKNKHKGKYLRERHSHPTKALHVTILIELQMARNVHVTIWIELQEERR